MKSFNIKSGQSDLKKVWIPCLAKYTCSGEAYHALAVCVWKKMRIHMKVASDQAPQAQLHLTVTLILSVIIT